MGIMGREIAASQSGSDIIFDKGDDQSRSLIANHVSEGGLYLIRYVPVCRDS